MTEKQLKLFIGNNYGIQSADGEVIIDSIISVGDAEVLCDLLNDLLNENEQLKQEVENIKDVNVRCCNDYGHYRRENEQLKQRNENQYNQLKQLWELIEKEDYNTLRSMLNQRETDEKLLQSEWRTYCD